MDQRFALSVLGFFCRSQFLLDLIADGGCKRCYRFKMHVLPFIEFSHSSYGSVDILVVFIHIWICQQRADIQRC